jgi:hypothetical protein
VIRLRTGAIVLGYNQQEYIEYSLRSLLPHVEHVVVVVPEAPFAAYNPRAREQFAARDGTREILVSLRREFGNLSVLEGIWHAEPEMRDAGLQQLRSHGVEICLSVDADEIYPDGTLERLHAEIAAADAPNTVYFARYLTCYRSFEYVVESNHRMAVAVHLAPGTHFPQRRRASGVRRDLPDEIFFWHMGYVLSDQRMWEKIRTFSHAHEVLPDWYQEKWLDWTPETRDLFRKQPASRWPRTFRIDPQILPGILHRHPYFPRHAGEGSARVQGRAG